MRCAASAGASMHSAAGSPMGCGRSAWRASSRACTTSKSGLKSCSVSVSVLTLGVHGVGQRFALPPTPDRDVPHNSLTASVHVNVLDANGLLTAALELGE